MQHLELEEAVDFVRGILSKAQEDSISEHLTSCTRCHAVARWATAVAATARDAQPLDPPSDVARKAIAIFSEAAERHAPLSVRLDRENAGIEVPLARVRATAKHSVRGQR
jgi:anti-sigma factor ChrR (cupin superfamily)